MFLCSSFLLEKNTKKFDFTAQWSVISESEFLFIESYYPVTVVNTAGRCRNSFMNSCLREIITLKYFNIIIFMPILLTERSSRSLHAVELVC